MLSILYMPLGEKVLLGALNGLVCYGIVRLILKHQNKKQTKVTYSILLNYFLSGDINDYYKSMVSLLKQFCNPELYLKKYDKEKVSAANFLYSKLHNENLSIEEIIQIREQIKSKLQTGFDTKPLFKALLNICQPHRYLNPYDPKMFSTMNELYSKLLANKDNLKELEIVGNEILKVSNFVKEKKEKEKKQKENADTFYKSSWLSDDRTK